jgi:hypothetical protein
MTENLLEPGEIVFTLLTLGAGAPLLLASPTLVTCNVPGAAGDGVDPAMAFAGGVADDGSTPR